MSAADIMNYGIYYTSCNELMQYIQLPKDCLNGSEIWGFLHSF